MYIFHMNNLLLFHFIRKNLFCEEYKLVGNKLMIINIIVNATSYNYI